MKLATAEYHQDNESAGRYVLKLCKELNFAVNKKHLNGIIEINAGNKKISINLADEVEYTRRNGKAQLLQSMLDSGDRFLNSPMSMGSTSTGIVLSSSYGSHSATVEGAGYIEPPEFSFSEDIIFYRKEAVAMFNAGNFVEFCRCYRAYLQSCVSLIDCFIHRYNFHIKMHVPDTAAYASTKTLDSMQSIEKRLEAWMEIFAIHKLSEVKVSKYWFKFMEIKKQRNNIVHPSNPTIPYGVEDAVKHLNYVQEGIGGILAELRKHSGNTANIGFINRVKTAPEIRILKKIACVGRINQRAMRRMDQAGHACGASR